MRLENVLNEMIGSQAKVRVARLVVTNPKSEHTGREVALLAGVSQPQTNEALKVLETYGVVESRAMGKAIVWKTNKQSHIYAELLLPLFMKEGDILAGLKKRLCKTLKPVSQKVVLFGSIAKGKGEASSDLDLCIVTKNKGKVREILSELQPEIAEKYNIVLSPLIYSPKEYAQSKIVEEGEIICKQE